MISLQSTGSTLDFKQNTNNVSQDDWKAMGSVTCLTLDYRLYLWTAEAVTSATCCCRILIASRASQTLPPWMSSKAPVHGCLSSSSIFLLLLNRMRMLARVSVWTKRPTSFQRSCQCSSFSSCCRQQRRTRRWKHVLSLDKGWMFSLEYVVRLKHRLFKLHHIAISETVRE